MNNVLIIYGPTKTGKTNLAISLAKKFNGEIISADSRQVYKTLDIGSGKVDFSSKVEKHHGYWIVDGARLYGFDLVEPQKQFTVADFLKFANTSISRIIKEKKLPIVVGGTGFYIKALTDGIDSIGTPKDSKLRIQLEKLSVDELYQKLLKVNSRRAKSMNESDRKNPRRLIRAIEIASYMNKKPMDYPINTKYKILNTKYLIIGLTAPNEYLYKKVDKWLETRLKKGLIEEIETLLSEKTDPKWLESLGLEYRWITRFLTGQVSKKTALEKLKRDTHGFVRRQKTWFSKFKDIQIFDVLNAGWQGRIAQKCKADIYSSSNGRIKNTD